tara:strand:+ start:724 stop:1653 length:930 start_codon:yes stop_codon:yes gene_type:complete
VPTKKKSKAAAAASDAPPDPRAPIEPTPANLAAALKQLKVVLADIPFPDPIIEEPEPEPEAPPATGKGGAAAKGEDASDDASDASDGADGTSAEKPAESKPAKPKEPIVRLPKLDYIDALLHIYFAEGLPCGYGQEVRRRIEANFVDRNEFRVTEAFEVEEMLSDLDIPNLFDRCLAVRESIAQVYNDQNGVHLTFLRDAGISDRNNFFQRVPAVQHHVMVFLTHLLAIEEICFSEKSTARAQQRIGLDPKSPAVAKFVDELRACLKPYGHVPVSIGPEGSNGKPNLKHTLSPACILTRLAPYVKPKRR